MAAKIKRYAVLLLALLTVFSITVVKAADRSSKIFEEAAYANFRNVRFGRIGENNLYRSQHPANGSSRSLYANKLAQEFGIRTVLNLSDSKKKLNQYFEDGKISPSYFYRTLYDRGSVYTAGLSTRYYHSSYHRKITDGLRFFAENKGPYLVHCEIGKDRTGLVILLLESLMGASYEDMLDDYAKTYTDRYRTSEEKARKKAEKYVKEGLRYITGTRKKTDWNQLDLVRYAEIYLEKGGMSGSEIFALKKNLSVSYPDPAIIMEFSGTAATAGPVDTKDAPDKTGIDDIAGLYRNE